MKLVLDVKSRVKKQLEQRQALLQLHVSDQFFYCLLRCGLYYTFDDNPLRRLSDRETIKGMQSLCEMVYY